MVTSALSCLPATLLQVLQPNSSLRAAVTMRLAASSCNFPQSTRVVTMVKNYLLCNCYNAFSHLQLQSRLPVPGTSQDQSCLAARSSANALCHSWLQTRISGASQQIDQPSRSADNADDSALLREGYFFLRFLGETELSLYSLVHILLPTSSSKSFPIASFFETCEVQIKLPLQSGALSVDNFPRCRDPTSVTPGARLPKKKAGFRARECFHR